MQAARPVRVEPHPLQVSNRRPEYQEIRREIAALQGEVMTVTDATLPPEQAKHAKSIISSQFARRMNRIEQMFNPPASD